MSARRARFSRTRIPLKIGSTKREQKVTVEHYNNFVRTISYKLSE